MIRESKRLITEHAGVSTGKIPPGYRYKLPEIAPITICISLSCFLGDKISTIRSIFC